MKAWIVFLALLFPLQPTRPKCECRIKIRYYYKGKVVRKEEDIIRSTNNHNGRRY